MEMVHRGLSLHDGRRQGPLPGLPQSDVVLSPGDRSVCRSKVNINGKLYSLAYGNPCSVHVDPIEKKPLESLLSGNILYFPSLRRDVISDVSTVRTGKSPKKGRKMFDMGNYFRRMW